MFTAIMNTPTPQVSEQLIDKAISDAKTAPICSRCGAHLRGAPRGQIIRCPRCQNFMRHVGDMWMQYVSPLELPPIEKPNLSMPALGGPKINGWGGR